MPAGYRRSRPSFLYMCICSQANRRHSSRQQEREREHSFLTVARQSSILRAASVRREAFFNWPKEYR